jgi:galactose-1-phosphate uridylyltransferase
MHGPGEQPLTRMADGTIKQVSPFTGTQVWTVPGRGHRPLAIRRREPAPLDPADEGRHCALCHLRYLDTPPEKARLVPDGAPTEPGRPAEPGGPVAGSSHWRTLRDLPAERLFDQVADLRRIPNLFEILSFDYWHANYGLELAPSCAERMRDYLAAPAGREHVLAVVRTRLAAAGVSDAEWAQMGENERLEPARAFFGGGHELIVARRHFNDRATHDDDLASSGSLTPDEHARYIAFTVDAMREVYAGNRYARYVAVFQNWLAPAGASFDHLHKQLVAIDERGVQVGLELGRLRENPNLYNEAAVNYAGYHNLVVAENEHAVAFAGFGHRYPTLEVFSKSSRSRPWEQTPAELRAMSDLLHACHAATGAAVPCNEEWHHRPADVDVPMPWRIMLKWRISTLAGFEGGTKIYLNTIDPWSLRDRVTPRLFELRAQGRIADMALGTECECAPNSLRYARSRA